MKVHNFKLTSFINLIFLLSISVGNVYAKDSNC